MYKKFYSWPPRILQTLAWGPTRLLFNIFCRFEVRGIENLRDIRQAIFAVNHTSELDSIILTAALNPLGRFAPLFYVAAPNKFFDDVSFGWRRFLYTTAWFFPAWGAYTYTAGHKNYALALNQHVEILKDGGSICIFPEGRITKDGSLQEGRGGVAFLCDATRVPIVPVYIGGVFGIRPATFLGFKRHMTLTFGQPLYVDSLFTEQYIDDASKYKNAVQLAMAAIGGLK